jgi:hypothetical protein
MRGGRRHRDGLKIDIQRRGGDAVLISVMGPGAFSLVNVLRAAGIQCNEQPQEMRRDVVSAAGGRFLRITQKSIPFAALAKSLHTWQTLRASRRVMLTNDHGQVVHTTGLGVEQIERALHATKQIDILDVSSVRKE